MTTYRSELRYGSDRWFALAKGEEPLPPELQAQGWHFCPDFDEELLPCDTEGGQCVWCGAKPP